MVPIFFFELLWFPFLEEGTLQLAMAITNLPCKWTFACARLPSRSVLLSCFVKQTEGAKAVRFRCHIGFSKLLRTFGLYGSGHPNRHLVRSTILLCLHRSG